MLHLTNAFSLNMFPATKNMSLDFIQLTLSEVNELLDTKGFCSAIGHTDTAVVVGNLLGRKLPESNRTTLNLDGIAWEMIVAQYTGPRLPEGATELPVGSKITFWYIRAGFFGKGE